MKFDAEVEGAGSELKSILRQLWHDWCFEQDIEDGPISMADIADFFDYVELMTDFDLEVSNK